MASGQNDIDVTLPVRNLDAATHFYLKALRPLRYEVISDVQHRLRRGPGSRSITLGPIHSQNARILLSESEGGVHRPSHISLPVSSRCDVRDIYASAIDAGGRPRDKPDYVSRHEAVFNMSVQDPDGNTFEAYYNDTVTSPSDYADESSVSGHRPAKSTTVKTTYYPVQRSSSHRRQHSPPPLSEDRPAQTGNAVVGTLLGAAAGVALGLVAFKSKQDSRHKENEHKAKMHQRESIETEARANTYDRQSTGVVENQHSPSSRRGSLGQERDSGYSSYGRDESPKRISYRHGSWPSRPGSQRSASADTRHSRHSSRDYTVRTKYVEYRPPSRSVQDRQSEASSQRTVRVGTQISRSNNVSRPPSPPTLPPTRPRRASSVKNRHTVYMSNEQDYNDRRSVTSSSKKGSVANTLPPSSFPKKSLPSTAKHTPASAPAPSSNTSKSSQTTVLPAGYPTAPVDQPAPAPEADPCKIDDLETVVPDDSISCVGSDREEERRSRTSKQSRQSRSSKRPNRGMDIVRRAGIVLN